MSTALPSGSWILLSGCSRGLGLTLARQVLTEGGQVAGLSSKTHANLQELQHQHGPRGPGDVLAAGALF